MPKIILDDKELEFTQGETIIQIADRNGIEIPRFCYHEKLSISGNCRMCLVEVERSPKLAASCHQPANDGMVVKTNSPKVQDARAGVMDFLLLNHPLDCPICDQGGECDLQDISFRYGKDSSTLIDEKRVVPYKDFGPLIQNHMTRCIICTRCVRFASEIAGIPEIGALGRGDHTEISMSVQQSITSELSGNLIDVCPVGALTAKPCKETYRPWELENIDAIDVFDAVGSNIQVSVKNNKIVRILPRYNEDVNEEWLADKSRFAFDGIYYQRIDAPYLNKDNKLEVIEWEHAIKEFSNLLTAVDSSKVAVLSGQFVDVESLFVIKNILNYLKVDKYDCRENQQSIIKNNPQSYLFNTTIKGLESVDACLIIGSNLRNEAPLINARLRKNYLRSEGKLQVGLIGQDYDMTFSKKYLGDNISVLKEILRGKHEFSKILETADNPAIIVGGHVLNYTNQGEQILNQIINVAHKYNIINDSRNNLNILTTSASQTGGLLIDFYNDKSIKTEVYKENIDLLILNGSSDIDIDKIPPTTKIVYIGHSGNELALKADLILPSLTYLEKEGTYVNTEGRIQKSYQTVVGPDKAKVEWQIWSELARCMHLEISILDNYQDIYNSLCSEYSYFSNLDALFLCKQKLNAELEMDKAIDCILENKIQNYYKSDVISKNSPTMARCTEALQNHLKDKEQ